MRLPFFLPGIAAICMLLSFPAKSTEEAFSWTGTYEGLFACDDVTNGRASSFGRDMKVEIVQEGEKLTVHTGAVVDDATGTSTSIYTGTVRDSAKGDVSSGYLEVCRSSFPYKELLRIFPATTDRDNFGFAADTIFISESLPGAEGDLVVESCKWSLKRISTDRPDIESCELK